MKIEYIHTRLLPSFPDWFYFTRVQVSPGYIPATTSQPRVHNSSASIFVNYYYINRSDFAGAMFTTGLCHVTIPPNCQYASMAYLFYTSMLPFNRKQTFRKKKRYCRMLHRPQLTFSEPCFRCSSNVEMRNKMSFSPWSTRYSSLSMGLSFSVSKEANAVAVASAIYLSSS